MFSGNDNPCCAITHSRAATEREMLAHANRCPVSPGGGTGGSPGGDLGEGRAVPAAVAACPGGRHGADTTPATRLPPDGQRPGVRGVVRRWRRSCRALVSPSVWRGVGESAAWATTRFRRRRKAVAGCAVDVGLPKKSDERGARRRNVLVLRIAAGGTREAGPTPPASNGRGRLLRRVRALAVARSGPHSRATGTSGGSVRRRPSAPSPGSLHLRRDPKRLKG